MKSTNNQFLGNLFSFIYLKHRICFLMFGSLERCKLWYTVYVKLVNVLIIVTNKFAADTKANCSWKLLTLTLWSIRPPLTERINKTTGSVKCRRHFLENKKHLKILVSYLQYIRLEGDTNCKITESIQWLFTKSGKTGLLRFLSQ